MDDDLRTTYQWAGEVYGEDIRQEAMRLLLEKEVNHQISYYRFLLMRLKQAGYCDTKLSIAHARTWGREQVMGTLNDGEVQTAALWRPAMRTPEQITLARDVLSRLPMWLICLHINEGVVYRRPCRHPSQWLYPYRSSAGTAIRCRRCFAERTQQWKEAHV